MKQLNATFRKSNRPWLGVLPGLALAGPARAQQAPAQLRGTWAGTVSFYGTPALVLFDFDALRQPGAGKATVALPSLGLHGMQVDRFAPVGDSISLVMSALPGSYRARLTADTLGLAGNPHVTTQEIPQVNHFFQTNAPGQEKSLFDNPETFSPAELRLLSSWLTQQAGLAPKHAAQKIALRSGQQY